MAVLAGGGEVGPRDIARLDVASSGRVDRLADLPWVELLDAAGSRVVPVDDFLRGLAANGSPTTTLYSYASSLLRWWRFLAAVDVVWDRATRVEVRDFVLWMRSRARRSPTAGPTTLVGYAPATINHSLAVLRVFYDDRLTVGEGPVINPVPTAVGPHGRVLAHHNPMEAFRTPRRAPFRQRVPEVTPAGLGDRAFDELFARMGCDRDRALLAFYVSTGARASELLGLTVDRVDVAGQVVGVFRKGSGRLQWLPASSDSFVWWRLYEARLDRPGGEMAVWLTRRSPIVALTYPAMRRVINRANSMSGTGWTLHDLRHTAARRLIADPAMSLTDVQWVLGHANLSTTAAYLRVGDDEVIARVLAHHRAEPRPAAAPPGGGYRSEVLDTLLGGHRAG